MIGCMFTPTRFPLLDQPARYSILDAARPVGDIPGLTDSAQSWGPGVALWYTTGGGRRWPHRRLFASPYTDDAIAGIGEPSVWPEPVNVVQSGQTVYGAASGLKASAPDPMVERFRSFSVYSPVVDVDLSSDSGEAADRAREQLRANVAGQIAAEFADSLFTLNPGLQRTAVDISGPSPVHVTEAVSALAEAYGTGYPSSDLSSGDGDAQLSVPWHAVPYLIEANLAEWVSGKLVDCFGTPINTTPGLVLSGPVADPDDLESAPAPAAGTGWFYVSPTPFVGLGSFERLPVGAERAGRVLGHSGVHIESNRSVGLAEAPAIVVFRPVRTYAVSVSLNKSVG